MSTGAWLRNQTATVPTHVMTADRSACRQCGATSAELGKLDPDSDWRCEAKLPTARLIGTGAKVKVELTGWMFDRPIQLGGNRALRANYAVVYRHLTLAELEDMAERGHPNNGVTTTITTRGGRQVRSIQYTVDWRESARKAIERAGVPGSSDQLAMGRWSVSGLRRDLASALSEAARMNERCDYAPVFAYVVEVER